MKISISIPFYNYQELNTLRYQITKKCFQHYYNIQQHLIEHDIFLYLNFVGSEEKYSYELSKPYLNDYNIYTEYNQNGSDSWWIKANNLRDKYNACFDFAKKCDNTFIYHCISGSNDFVGLEFFKKLVAIDCNHSSKERKMNTELGLIGVSANRNTNNLIVLDYLNKRGFTSIGRYRHISNQFIGGFYALTNKLLADLDWKPFQFDGDEIGLELYCADKYKMLGIDSDILNIKSDSDINSYDDCLLLKDNDIDSHKLESILLYIDSL